MSNTTPTEKQIVENVVITGLFGLALSYCFTSKPLYILAGSAAVVGVKAVDTPLNDINIQFPLFGAGAVGAAAKFAGATGNNIYYAMGVGAVVTALYYKTNKQPPPPRY